jgi:hypothetical protein
MVREWIGVDLDGTTCEYHGWVRWCEFGTPIPAMIERIRRWLAEGKDVRIVTARVGLPRIFAGETPRLSVVRYNTCHKTGERFSDAEMAEAVQRHLAPHLNGAILPVQCYKDPFMTELWDDRAVQVVPNTGRTLAEEHEAEMTALRGRAFGDDESKSTVGTDNLGEGETIFDQYDSDCIPGS